MTMTDFINQTDLIGGLYRMFDSGSEPSDIKVGQNDDILKHVIDEAHKAYKYFKYFEDEYYHLVESGEY